VRPLLEKERSRVRLQWTRTAVWPLLTGVGCAAACLALEYAARRRRAKDREIAAIWSRVQAVEMRLETLRRAASPQPESEAISAAAEGAGMMELAEPKPETLAVITAAATAFLGKAARIRSARLVPAQDDSVSAWSQQGRVIVQTSHNLRSRE